MRFASSWGSSWPFLSEYACEDFNRILKNEKGKLHFWSLIAVHANVNIHL